MSSRPIRPRWYINCEKSENGEYVACTVLPKGLHDAAMRGWGRWILESEYVRNREKYEWSPGRRYRNKSAADRAVRSLLAQFPGIRLEISREFSRPSSSRTGRREWWAASWVADLTYAKKQGSP